MERMSLMFRARVEQAHHRRRNAALDAWAKVRTDEPLAGGGMPCEFQELYECSLLSPKELERAIARKIYLLKSNIEDAQADIEHMTRELRELS